MFNSSANNFMNQQYYAQLQQEQQSKHLETFQGMEMTLGNEQVDLNEIMSPLSPQDSHPNSLAGSPFSQTNQFYSLSVPTGSFQSSFNPSLLSGSVQEVNQIEDKRSVDAINEKRRKRRESHNAVERRRRDHINEKIQELASLLPEFASDVQNKPNKGVILRRSVEYIRHMQVFAARQMDRSLELEQVLMRLCQSRGISEDELGLSTPLGTRVTMPEVEQYAAGDLDE